MKDMRDDPQFNIEFVRLVEGHPCLYDHTLADYCNKSKQDEAWDAIGKKLSENSWDCRNRWKNLRACYTRYLKHKTERCRKPYYLAEFMEFVAPFTKPRIVGSTSTASPPEITSPGWSIEDARAEDLCAVSQTHLQDGDTRSSEDGKWDKSKGPNWVSRNGDLTICAIAPEKAATPEKATTPENATTPANGVVPANGSDNASTDSSQYLSIDVDREEEKSAEGTQIAVITNGTGGGGVMEIRNTTSATATTTVERRKEEISRNSYGEKFSSLVKEITVGAKRCRFDESLSIRLEEEPCLSADLQFFRSILPDMKLMDASQKRKLKIGILSLVDEILCSSPNITNSSITNDSSPSTSTS